MSRRDGITTVTSSRTGRVTYRARVSWTDPDGTRRHRSKSFRGKRDAERWRREQLSKIDRGEWFEPGTATVAELAERWLATVDRSRAPSTARKYRKVYDGHIGPRFGARKVASIRATEIQAWYDELGQRYKPRSVEMIHKVLRGIVGQAITDGIIRVDPLAGRKLPTERSDPPRAWSPEDAQRFLHATATDDDAIPMVVMLVTGMRIGETLALQWEDVDLTERTARVHRTIQQTPSGIRIAETTKTRSSTRMVALPAVAVLALRRQHAITGDGALVFPRVDGGIQRGDMVRKRLAQYCDNLALPAITPHDLRRTAATMMLAQGVHPAIAARQLGHTVSLMLSRYAVVSVELQQQAADALDTMLSSTTDVPKTGHGGT